MSLPPSGGLRRDLRGSSVSGRHGILTNAHRTPSKCHREVTYHTSDSYQIGDSLTIHSHHFVSFLGGTVDTQRLHVSARTHVSLKHMSPNAMPCPSDPYNLIPPEQKKNCSYYSTLKTHSTPATPKPYFQTSPPLSLTYRGEWPVRHWTCSMQQQFVLYPPIRVVRIPTCRRLRNGVVPD